VTTHKTIADVIKEQRAERARNVEMECAWQDFLELTAEQQKELVFVACVQNARDLQWCVEAISKIERYRPQLSRRGFWARILGR
jgi:hypothetical protein